MRTKQTSILMAAALAVGGLSVVSVLGQQSSDQSQISGSAQVDQKGIQASAQTGGQPLSAVRNSDDIRRILGTTADSAVSINGFDDLVQHFSQADRDRIGGSHSYDDLNNAIQKFQKDWQQKYGTNFSIQNPGPVFTDEYRVMSDTGQNVRTAGERLGGENQNLPQTQAPTPPETPQQIQPTEPRAQVQLSAPLGVQRGQSNIIESRGVSQPNYNFTYTNQQYPGQAAPAGERTMPEQQQYQNQNQGEPRSDASMRSDMNAPSAQSDLSDRSQYSSYRDSADQSSGVAMAPDENPINARVASNKDRPLNNPALNQGAQSNTEFRGEAQTASERTGPVNPRNDMNRSDQYNDLNKQPAAGSQSAESDRLGARTAGEVQTGEHLTLIFPASHNLQPVNVKLVQEGGTWKLDVPDNLSTDDLHRSLLHHITMLDQNFANWPADQNDAKRLVAHHIMEAIYSPQTSGSSLHE